MPPTSMSRDDWDERYARADGTVWAPEPNAWLVEQLAALAPTGEPGRVGTAADLACGEGRTALWLAQRGWDVTGVDWSGVGLATAARRADGLGLSVRWVRADVTTWRPPAPVDLVTVAYLQLPPEQTVRAVRAATAALVPGGHLVWIGHHVENLIEGTGGPQDPVLLQSEDRLLAGASGLDVDRCGTWRRPVAGAGRPAVDAVLVGRRRG